MRSAALAFICSAMYATVRYNICKGVAWSDWPAYTLNKAFAVSALALLIVFVLRARWSPGGRPTQILSLAGGLAALHVLVSLVLLSPDYYEKLFQQGRLTATAGLSIVLGAAAAVAMAAGALKRGGQGTGAGAGSIALLSFLIGVHAALQGFAGWFAPQTWPGTMPPLTLIAFGLGALAVGLALYPRRSA